MSGRLSRRGFVGGAAALSTAALWPLRPSRAAMAMGFDEARHLLSRASFGATPAEIRSLEALDYAQAVDRLDVDDQVGFDEAAFHPHQEVAASRENCGGTGRASQLANGIFH